MTRDDILNIINQIVSSCTNKNATHFADLFADSGVIIFENNHLISKQEIEIITHKYFANLEYIKIKINDILIDKNKALIEWNWEDCNCKTQEKKHHNNIIYLKFDHGLITYWREYRQ